ncbi:MAG: amino acid ABC transporter permease [SAR324 cluster bacterium]|nr:amino acid ABC transporter permease [SAR324 cluster bacterium]
MQNSVPKRIVLKTRWWNSKWFDVLQLFVFMVGLMWVTLKGANEMGYNWQWYRIPQYFYEISDGDFYFGPLIEGLFVTMEITAYSIFITLLVGLTTAMLRMSNSISGRLLAWLYLEIVRNTPLLVQMFVFYFVLGPILNLDRFWVGVLCISLFEGSFASEIIRAGILSVVKGQWEASYSVGLTQTDTYRYVVLPQAVPLMLPPLTGVIINLIKHSAIVSVIAVFDLTTQALDLIAETFMSFEIWLTVAGIYLLLTITLSVLVTFLERWVRQRS